MTLITLLQPKEAAIHLYLVHMTPARNLSGVCRVLGGQKGVWDGPRASLDSFHLKPRDVIPANIRAKDHAWFSGALPLER